MKLRSLRWRLLVIGAAAILLAIGAAGTGLALLFDRHVERVAVADLEGRALAIAARVDPRNPADLREDRGDPQYQQPFSGHYWQISLGETIHRSRSLWDHRLDLPAAPPAGAEQVLTLAGPRGEALLALDRGLLIGAGPGAIPLRITLARDRAGIETARRAFMADLLPYLGVLGLLLLAASAAQVTLGLAPLSYIGQRVGDLAAGRRRRIGEGVPLEIAPLAAEIDSLLDAREAEVEKARHRAADLAHGFKTPLQALHGDASRLRDMGAGEIAASVEATASAMRRHVDRELARARIQTGHLQAACDPTQVLARVLRVLQRTPKGGDILWDMPPGEDTRAAIDAGDLTEALGALLENALRHSHSRVTITQQVAGRLLHIAIRDDGPGVPEDQLHRMIRRGVRLDESSEGQGIGLSIAQEIAEAAGGALAFENAQPGLRATLTLRCAAPVAGDQASNPSIRQRMGS